MKTMPFPSLSQLPDGHQAQRGRPQLMLVDDEPLIIHALHSVFDGMYDLVFATSGARALELCLECPPDLLLLDVNMPDMSGLDLCRRLKLHDQTSDIPVIFVTAGINLQDENACWEAGGVDFVSKPFNPNTIKHRVHAHLTLKLQTDLLRRMVFVDGLTGVANRRYFDESLALEWSHCKREGAMLSVAMIDVDYFKRFNDGYGHQAGDDCLRRVAGAIRASLRRSPDVAARYGGEEFACVFPRTEMIGAIGICKKIEAAVRALEVPHQASDAAAVVTVSIGIASAKPSEDGTTSDLVRQADAALYEAKQGGRARVFPVG